MSKNKKTIGTMTKTRGDWGAINPVTKVVKDKKNSYSRKIKHKKGLYE